ncbi:MAG: superoxide dismutase family protein [Myxococcota bacterium]
MFLLSTLACAVTGSSAFDVDDAPVHGAGELASVAVAEPHLPGPREALAPLEARAGSRVTGTVTFAQEPGPPGRPILVSIRLADAGPGNHAVFLHEIGDCSAADASSAGGWYGPAERPNKASVGSGPADADSTSPPPGYLGFVTVGADGRGEKDIVLHAFTLSDTPPSLVDRAVVVYERAPDFTAGGDPGARQACGVIKG